MSSALSLVLVPRTRLELARLNRHYPLKVACLPIPPPGQRLSLFSRKRVQKYYIFPNAQNYFLFFHQKTIQPNEYQKINKSKFPFLPLRIPIKPSRSKASKNQKSTSFPPTFPPTTEQANAVFATFACFHLSADLADHRLKASFNRRLQSRLPRQHHSRRGLIRSRHCRPCAAGSWAPRCGWG